MSDPIHELAHSSSSEPETECNNVIVTEEGLRVCADTGVVLDDSPIENREEWRAYDTEEYVSRAHAQLLTPGAPVGSVVLGDDELAVLNAKLVGRDVELLQRAEEALIVVLADGWQALREKLRKDIVYEVKRMLDEVQRRGVRLTPCVAQYVAYKVALKRGLRARKPCTPYHKRVIDVVLQSRGYTVKVDARREALSALLRCADELHLDAETRRLAMRILDELLRHSQGRKPRSLAAAALYLASLILSRRVTQPRAAAACGVTDNTVRNVTREFIEHHDVIVLLGP